AIALFILLIACINYMNLGTARSMLRAKEIGVRKVAGADKKELVMQFLMESILVTWIAAILAFVLTWVTLPWLNKLSGLPLSTSLLFKGIVIVPIVLMPFITGLLAGIYPALFLSSFQPIRVLKGLMKTGGTHASFRRTLVVAQFGISIALIICTGIVFRQLQYMQNMSLGIEKDHIVTLPYPDLTDNGYESFRTQLLADAGIRGVTRSSRVPSGRLLDDNGASINMGDSLVPSKADIKCVRADEDFVPTYGIKMAAGRNFSRSYGSDSTAFVINEEAVRALGLHSNEEAIGKQFKYGPVTGQLVGVMSDFHFEDLHQPIIPIILQNRSGYNSYHTVSINITGNTQHALQHIEETWKKFLPETPYKYTFLNERFAKLYQAEQKQGTIFTVFAGIAIFIACLGLFGLSAFATSQRVKEIGIRKVLGAGTITIVRLLSADFLKLVAISALIAFPVAWYIMHHWLNDFAYRTNIPWWIFLLAGIVAALVALVTISFQAVKAALANPVKSLRSE
ncbi:MAG: FtsX-like permease family protein, partial [Bacteroidetes bacterium]|nr:FtsX-like permease family protein [Bacteroidota bacterium]